MLELILTIFVMAGAWRMYQKMGRQGWEGIVPIYNVYVLCDVLYGQGWRCLLFLVPLYNIYYTFRVAIDLARGFHQGVGYGIGLALLGVVFVPLTGFGGAVFGDGSRMNYSSDPISRTLDEISSELGGSSGSTADSAPRQSDREVLRMLRELEALRNAGILTEEEFAAKKAELLKKI